MSFDVVPAFVEADHFLIPDDVLGEWIPTNPQIHKDKATEANKAFSDQWKPLVKMAKKWNDYNGSPVDPSFLIEVMALDLISGEWTGSHPREIRQFFASAADRIGDSWPDPAGVGPEVNDVLLADSAALGTARRALADANAVHGGNAARSGGSGRRRSGRLAEALRSALRQIMTGEATDPPSITERQNDSAHLSRLLAYSHEYRVARWWRTVRMAGTLLLALASPFVVILWSSESDLLAAIAAAWLVVGRTALTRFEDHRIDQAARVQELYDTRLFNLPWNRAVAGREPAPDDVAAAAHRIKNDAPYRDWYTVDVSGCSDPEAVLLCQRQSAVWARRDHIGYSRVLYVTAAMWALFGVVFALSRNMTLAEYLVKLFLPSAPAYLYSIELARSHVQHSKAREQIENDLGDLWDRRETQVLTLDDCREVQDAAFTLRRTGPRAPTGSTNFDGPG